MDTIIVTGGAGFIGSNFVRHMLKHTPFKVVVVDKLTYAGSLLNLDEVSKDPRFDFHRVDIADAAAVDEVFAKTSPRYVVNFAAETHVDRSIDGPRAFVETNVVGTFVLLDSARRLLKDRSPEERERFRFLHVSTDEVYGTLGASGLFSETTPYAPNSPYSATKAGADHLVRAYHETFGLPVLITNCSNNYGPFQFPEKLIPLTILNAMEGRPLPIYGDGGNIRDWLHVEDHCSAIRLVLEKGRLGEKYNVGGRNERTNLQIVDAICRTLEEKSPAARNAAFKDKAGKTYADLKTFVADRPGHDRRYAIDATKITRELGWNAQYRFETGIVQTVEWYLAHLDWCRSVQDGKYRRERLGLKEAR